MNRKMTLTAMACSMAVVAYAHLNTASANEVKPTAQAVNQEERTDARDLISEATGVVQTMKADPELNALLQQAKGIVIVPNYGSGALEAGGHGGEGALLACEGGRWGNPVFYRIGGINADAQVGAEGGTIVMLLMSEHAVDRFKQPNSFALNADNGLTLSDYAARAKGSTGKSDVIFWSDSKGAYTGVTLGATDVSYDQDANRAYYRANNVTAARILSGQVMNPRPHAAQLKAVLPAT